VKKAQGWFARSKMCVELCGPLQSIFKKDLCETVGELVGDCSSLSASQSLHSNPVSFEAHLAKGSRNVDTTELLLTYRLSQCYRVVLLRDSELFW
jgi:hypothetical protein